jgi:DNA-binding NarL/FixJ family response regulator
MNPPRLTKREADVCRLLATQGASNTDIAASLLLSVASVKRYIERARSKYAAKNRTLLAIEFYRDFLLSQKEDTAGK